MTDLLIICQLFPLILLLFKIGFDYKKWKEQKKINHILEWCIVAGLTIAFDWLLLQAPDLILDKWGLMYASLLLSGAVGFIFFEWGYDLVRGQSLMYIGDDKPYSSKIDRVFHFLNRFFFNKDSDQSIFPLIFEGVFLIIASIVYYFTVR
jgi:hypothetical protein